MPHVVLGALVRDHHVLLGLRSRHKLAYPGVWELPGGVVEADEWPLPALVRELAEELGVRVELGSVSFLAESQDGPLDSPLLVDAWLVREWQGSPTNRAPGEHDRLRWFTASDLPRLVHPPIHDALLDALGAGPD